MLQLASTREHIGLAGTARLWLCDRRAIDPARACLAALVLADILLVWSLPVIVGQDLPQHLAYARILADYANPRLAFQDNFVLPLHVQPYFTAYLLLAPLTCLTSVLTACRILYTGYVVAMAAAFASLVMAVHATAPAEAPARMPWTCLFGALLPWNPVQCVGFLPFMLALPAVLFGAAAVVRSTRPGSQWSLVLIVFATAAATSLHLVAGVALVAFAWLFAVFRRSRRGARAATLTTSATIVTVLVWHTLGERGLAELPSAALAASIAHDGLWDGVVQTLGVQWTSFAVKWSFVVATVLGPLTHGAKILVGVALVALVAASWLTRHGRPARTRATSRPFVLAVVAFAALVVVTPAAIRVPDDICLLDFRLYVLAFLLLVACVDPRWLEPLRARVGVVVFSAFVLVVWARQLDGAAKEATSVLHLVEGMGPRETVLALPFHNRSEFLDKDNDVTHYLPVYYTALHGGVTSLFWGKFSHHLPVGYRAGREPQRPPDWDPSRFTRAELLGASRVLVEWPDADDGDLPVAGAARLRRELATGFTETACEGRWCLFEPASLHAPVTETEEALR